MLNYHILLPYILEEEKKKILMYSNSNEVLTFYFIMYRQEQDMNFEGPLQV